MWGFVFEFSDTAWVAFWRRGQYTKPMSTPPLTRHLSSTQIGAIGENLLVNAVMKASKGRLSPFKPVADDDGLDVLFFHKDTGNSVAIQLKCRANTDRRSNSKERGNTAQFDVRKATFKDERRASLVAGLLNEGMTDFVCAWFIPMEEMNKVGNERSDKYVITPSKAEVCKDKYKKYRYENTDKLVQRIIEDCESSPRDRSWMVG
jgi:hypothetical protein